MREISWLWNRPVVNVDIVQDLCCRRFVSSVNHADGGDSNCNDDGYRDGDIDGLGAVTGAMFRARTGCESG